MKLSETQQKALDIVQELIKEDKITLQQAFDLITAIYENEKEYVYIPTVTPDPVRPWTPEPWTTPSPTIPWPNTPWYQKQYEITCHEQANANSTNKRPGYELHAIGAPWQHDYLFGGWQGTITR